MDSSKCVVCFESKAKNFCIDCKQSSGICHSCYMDISQRTDDSSYVPINCVICKKKMNYSLIVNFCEFDMMTAGENTLIHTGNDDKNERLSEIQIRTYYEEWDNPDF